MLVPYSNALSVGNMVWLMVSSREKVGTHEILVCKTQSYNDGAHSLHFAPSSNGLDFAFQEFKSAKYILLITVVLMQRVFGGLIHAHFIRSPMTVPCHSLHQR